MIFLKHAKLNKMAFLIDLVYNNVIALVCECLGCNQCNTLADAHKSLYNGGRLPWNIDFGHLAASSVRDPGNSLCQPLGGHYAFVRHSVGRCFPTMVCCVGEWKKWMKTCCTFRVCTGE